MNAEIIRLSGLTNGDVPVEDVLAGAAAAGLDEVLVIGQLPDGKLYLAASTGDAGRAMFFVEMFKRRLFAGFDDLI